MTISCTAYFDDAYLSRDCARGNLYDEEATIFTVYLPIVLINDIRKDMLARSILRSIKHGFLSSLKTVKYLFHRMTITDASCSRSLAPGSGSRSSGHTLLTFAHRSPIAGAVEALIALIMS